MNWRSAGWAFVAALIAVALVALLLRVSGITVPRLLSIIGDLKTFPVIMLVAATLAHLLLAAEKWRIVEERLSKSKPRMLDAWGYTAIGAAIGQLLPMFVASTAARAIGNRFHRSSSAARGATASVWEQLFDLAVAALLALPTALAVGVGSVRLFQWTTPVAVLAGWLAIPAFLRSFDRWPLAGRRLAESLRNNGLLEVGLARQLYILSVARLGLLCAMAVAVNLAVGGPVPHIDLVAAMPAAILASTLSMLPGGLGANEWSFAALLTSFGTDLRTAAEWALVNRMLVAGISIALGALAVILLQRGGRGLLLGTDTR